MAEKKFVSPLMDETNVKMEIVEEDPKITDGMSVEDAYRFLAGFPPEPVIEAEEG